MGCLDSVFKLEVLLQTQEKQGGSFKVKLVVDCNQILRREESIENDDSTGAMFIMLVNYPN